MTVRLKKQYFDKVVPELMKRFNYKNKFQASRIVKIVINMGIGEAKDNPKLLSTALEEMAMITGQRPVITRARKSIASFKLRAGMQIGCKVTLRGNRMYEFFDRLVNVALPRVRDFKGLLPKSFDTRGNYNIGVTEQIIFPEIEYDKVEKIHGLDIAIVINKSDVEQNREMLKMMGLPLRSS